VILSQEVYRNHPYDGVGSDFWALAVILFNLLTNQPLYSAPRMDDVCFGYFILAEGLSSADRNDRMRQLHEMVRHMALATEDGEPLIALEARIAAVQALDEDAVELLENLLAIDPRDRWSFAQAFDYFHRMG
jgi:serine/threonine protein kinase